MRICEEGKRRLKASVANIALFLSIFVVLFPLTLSTVSADGEYNKIIYVDDDNTDPPWIGNETDPFQYIQDAVLEARQYTGNILIRVWEGTYIEKVTIESPYVWSHLTIQGNGSSVTTIQPDNPVSPGTVITINYTSFVNVIGFTIKDGTGGEGGGIRINTGHNNQIYNCNLTQNTNGICIDRSNNNVINNTEIFNNSKNGVYIRCGAHNQIIDNNLISSNTESAIKLEQCYSTPYVWNNTIDNNNILYNEGSGILLHGAHNN